MELDLLTPSYQICQLLNTTELVHYEECFRTFIFQAYFVDTLKMDVKKFEREQRHIGLEIPVLV